jgi:hypothetical protein
MSRSDHASPSGWRVRLVKQEMLIVELEIAGRETGLSVPRDLLSNLHELQARWREHLDTNWRNLLRAFLRNRFLGFPCAPRRDSRLGCGPSGAAAGWPRSPERRSATRLI